jgi:hypothetical protein
MGKRSISSTKTGKFMNPTDQASQLNHLNLKYYLNQSKKIFKEKKQGEKN